MTSSRSVSNFQRLYKDFSSPITGVDCGLKCGPYNDYGIPICCDICQVVPSAFEEEWRYLESETDLWSRWEGSSTSEGKELLQELERGQIPLQCLGHEHCQRQFRTITCRAFPFLPYMDSRGKFVGFTYYPDYRELCWIISNLSLVTLAYKKEFQRCFQEIFEYFPEMKKNYQEYSAYLRDMIPSKDNDLVFFDFIGRVFQINPSKGIPQEVSYQDLQSFGPFEVSKDLVFSDEIDPKKPGKGTS
jgi:hypothetical protein